MMIRAECLLSMALYGNRMAGMERENVDKWNKAVGIAYSMFCFGVVEKRQLRRLNV